MKNRTTSEIRTAMKELNMNNPGPANYRDNPGITKSNRKGAFISIDKSPANHACLTVGRHLNW